MSLHNLAKKVQGTGRGKDSMLVHMSPREVRGLEQLARIKGGKLTTNPKTGLPEAGFLEDILPMVAAGAAIYFTAGAAAPALMSAGMGATSAGILAGAGSGALIGAGSAAIQGGDVGQAALMGGVTGAIGGGISGAMGGAAPTPGVESAGTTAVGQGTSAAAANAPLQQATTVGTNAINVNPSTGMAIDPLAGAAAPAPTAGLNALPGAQGGVPLSAPAQTSMTPQQIAGLKSTDAYNLDRLALERGVMAEGVYQLPGQGLAAAPAQVGPQTPPSTSTTDMGKWWDKQTPWEKAGYSTLGAGLVAGLNAPPNESGAPDEDYTSPLKRISPNFQAQQPIQPNPYYRARYPVYAAEGGLMALAGGGATNLGGYSDGGRMLKGPGDGMSDNIPATIGGKQPARLADGEFVVPADVVSHLGNGSTDAGAKRLYAMMDKVRTARTGKKKQAPAVNTNKLLPA